MEVIANVEVEEAVLAILLYNPDCWQLTEHTLQSEYFYIPAHREIHETMQRMREQGTTPDLVSLTEHLQLSKRLDSVGGMSKLGQILDCFASRGSLEGYIKLLADKHFRRRAILACESFIVEANDANSDIKEKAGKLSEMLGKGDAIPAMSDGAQLFQRFWDSYEKEKEEQSTGFQSLDELWKPEFPSLAVLAARPSMGKTSVALQLFYWQLKLGRKCIFFSCETSAESLMTRMIAQQTKIGLSVIKNALCSQQELQAMFDFQGSIPSDRILMADAFEYTVEGIIAQVMQAHAVSPVGFVAIDYLQLLGTSERSGSPNERISVITRKLKLLSKDTGCCILLLSQLSRACEARNDKRPIMSDLRDSGAPEQDADVILSLYRDEVYNKEGGNSGDIEIAVLKQRDGPTGTVTLRWMPEVVSVYESTF